MDRIQNRQARRREMAQDRRDLLGHRIDTFAISIRRQQVDDLRYAQVLRDDQRVMLLRDHQDADVDRLPPNASGLDA